jgi:hypothetical protein
MGNHTHYVAYGDLHVVGEVFNHTSGIISYLEVYIDLFDSDGRLLDTDWTFTELIDVPPETKACFHLWLDEPLGWSYYDLYGYYHNGGEPLPTLTVFNDSSFLEYDGDYRVVGIVRNDHGTRVEYVQPVITLYDSGGRVIDCGYTYVNAYHLDPGQSRAFENTFYDRHYSVVTSYKIVVDGYPQ